MAEPRISLGLDLSTQSLSAAAVDMTDRRVAASVSLDYVTDPRLAGFGLDLHTCLLPARIAGEADQPPELFLAALDALFGDLRQALDPATIGILNVSAQQHGHVYLNDGADETFRRLSRPEAAASDLPALLEPAFAYDRAPTWMTANTGEAAAFIRNHAGGKEALVRRTGSDTQLRFTGPIIRTIGRRFPDVYQDTGTIQLLSSFITGVLTANARVPWDFGNACGTSLMDYHAARWDETLIAAVSGGLPGGAAALRKKLPDLVAPDAIVGTVCRYFTDKYGLSPDCLVAVGSGDNPQSKVLVAGDLLSLGSSLVIMAATDGTVSDLSGASSAMYDGLGRPFAFGCRTNGALVWDEVRARYGFARENYAPAEQALAAVKPGDNLVFWQPRPESFPASGSFGITRAEGTAASFAADYAGIVESSLAAVYHHSHGLSRDSSGPLRVTGGAAASPGIVRRVAAIWNRPVVALSGAGAALGAAAAGIVALNEHGGKSPDITALVEDLVATARPIVPHPADVTAFHAPGGYLERLAAAESALIHEHPAA